MNKIDMTVVNEETLTHTHADQELVTWFITNICSLPVSKITSIIGDHTGYVTWLVDKYINTTYDAYGRVLSHIDKNGYFYIKTYDIYGNMLTYNNSAGYSCTKTYDTQGNPITHKGSDNYSWTRTYDKLGNELTYADNRGYMETYNYSADNNVTHVISKDGVIIDTTYYKTSNSDD